MVLNKRILSKTLFITHRTSLAQSISAKYGLICYKDQHGDGEYEDALYHRGLALQVESLHKLTSVPKLLVIDEADHVLKQFCSTTVRKRYKTLSIFKKLLQQTDKIIFMSATLTNHPFDILAKLKIKVDQYIHNTNLPSSTTASPK